MPFVEQSELERLHEEVIDLRRDRDSWREIVRLLFERHGVKLLLSPTLEEEPNDPDDFNPNNPHPPIGGSCSDDE